MNGKNGIRMAVNKQSGKNTVEVARRVLEEIERINRDIPQINLVTIMDTSEYIKNSISNVGHVRCLRRRAGGAGPAGIPAQRP